MSHYKILFGAQFSFKIVESKTGEKII